MTANDKPALGVEPGAESGDFSLRASLPRSAGLVLAVNAVPDAYLLLDGPHCVFHRIVYVQGNHDWASALTLFPGLSRINNTELDPLQVIRNRDAALTGEIEALASHPECGVALVDGLSMAVVTATDYGRLCDQVSRRTGTPAIPLPHRSLTADWLTAYEEVMETLARKLPLPARRTGHAQPQVGVVGHLYDRNEGDQRGNIEELARLATALDVTLLPPWFSGHPTAALARIADADVILSLPYGRRAARILAERLGVPLVEAPLPCGVEATVRFVELLGETVARRAEAAALVARELGRVMRAVEWLVPFTLLHRRLGYVGDPHLYGGVAETAALLGCRLVFAALTNERRHARDSHPAGAPGVAEAPEFGAPPAPVWFPKAATLARHLGRLVAAEEVDVLVTNSYGALTANVGIVELGFPSYHRHFLYPRPFLGFGGALALIEDIANAIHRNEVLLHNRPPPGGTR
jgi:nitrogenase molybdenum-iron protein alpha/beta subunit